MASQSSPPPFNFFGDRLADIIKQAIKQQMAQSDRQSAAEQDEPNPQVTEMIEQQQQTNAQLGHLVTAVSQLSDRMEENTREVKHNAAPPFWKKMALEVPPVVLAVLMAFGINSWWQGVKEERKADLAVESIIAEIKENDATLERNIALNEAEIEGISAKIQSIENGEGDSVDAQGPVHIFALTEAAWQTASTSSVFQNIDKNLIMDAAEIYNLQLSREDRIDGYFFTVLSSPESFQEDNQSKLIRLKTRRSFLGILLETDRTRQGDYRQFLRKYDQSVSANEQ